MCLSNLLIQAPREKIRRNIHISPKIPVCCGVFSFNKLHFSSLTGYLKLCKLTLLTPVLFA